MRRSLRGQVVVLTGASSGIGRCAALHFAARGAAVVLTARREQALRELADGIEAAGGRALVVPGDVTREADLRRVADAAVERFGRIDTWVNNAAVYLQGRVQDITLDEYRRILDVNLVGVINGTQRALEVMLPQGDGVIIQVSSIAAKRGVPWTSAYSAAKAGIDGFTSTLRAELRGTGVRLSILYPPTVDTPIYDNARGGLGVVPKPAPPVADPREAARAIAQLARTGRRYRYFGWSRPLSLLDAASPAAGDWLLHRVAGFTYSDRPAGDDSVDEPSTETPPSIRAGWADGGWKGLRVREAARVLPWQTVLAAAAVGYVAGRTLLAGRAAIVQRPLSRRR